FLLNIGNPKRVRKLKVKSRLLKIRNNLFNSLPKTTSPGFPLLLFNLLTYKPTNLPTFSP
ncbi:hypothetical protein KKB99_07310, partial [bacterium]|nr:hypothetical protein [bacterium]MBU1025800.1 hypothetical protein [bacterium]